MSHSGKVVRAARERTRGALTRAWVRMWRFSTWEAASSAGVAKVIAPRPAGSVRDQMKASRNAAAEDDRQWQRKDGALGRQQQGMEMARRPSVHGLCTHVCSGAVDFVSACVKHVVLTHADAHSCRTVEFLSRDPPCLSPKIIVVGCCPNAARCLVKASDEIAMTTCRKHFKAKRV